VKVLWHSSCAAFYAAIAAKLPWREFVQASDFKIRDLSQNPGEPSLWIYAVHLGGFDQGRLLVA